MYPSLTVGYPGCRSHRARIGHMAPEAAVAGGEFVRWPRETPLVPALTAKIVPHMFRIIPTGAARARLSC